MLRSGAIHCCAEACAPVPDLAELVFLNETAMDNLADKTSSTSSSGSSSLKGGNPGHNDSTAESNPAHEGLFESLSRSSEPCTTHLSLKASQALDRVLDDLARSLSESSDYFQLLVQVFRPFFRDPRHVHLRLFHLIVPPLTVNFVEHIVTCKEKLNKKNKQDHATFTDDGLAMGVAYCLAVLDQWKDFDALQWSASVGEYFDEQRRTVRAPSHAKDVDKLQQTQSLTLHRLDTYKQVLRRVSYQISAGNHFILGIELQEFDLLFYNMNSARIFFREERIAGDLKSLGASSLAAEAGQSSHRRHL